MSTFQRLYFNNSGTIIQDIKVEEEGKKKKKKENELSWQKIKRNF